MSEETLYSQEPSNEITPTEPGDSWSGGFPDELKVLDSIGIENPEALSKDQLQGFRALYSDWGPNFETNYGHIGEYFKAVFSDEGELEEFNQLISDPMAAKKMFDLFKRHEVMKQLSQENKEGQLDFKDSMREVMRKQEINDLRNQLILEKFRHLTELAGEKSQKGGG